MCVRSKTSFLVLRPASSSLALLPFMRLTFYGCGKQKHLCSPDWGWRLSETEYPESADLLYGPDAHTVCINIRPEDSKGTDPSAGRDGDLSLQSLVDFMDTLAARDKILILDCCYSGNFTTAGARRMHFEDAIADFAGHGIAVLASSSADQVSRLGPGANHSLFTGALSTAMVHNKKIRKGRLSLTDINEEAQRLVRAWNQNNSGKEQHPVFRSSMGGTIYFQVEDYQPYQQRELSYETEYYRLVKVEPLSSPSIKRLCAFVILKKPGGLSALAAYSREIADRIKHEEIYSGPSSEARFKGTPARAVWCYFGHDESDMVNHLYYAYTIWAPDEDLRRLYFKSDKKS